MTTLTITDLSRCSGGNHYKVTVDVDGELQALDFEAADIDRRQAETEKLSQLVLPVVLDDIISVRREAGVRKATLEAERTAVVGRTIESRGTVETDVRTRVVAEGGS